MIRKLLFRRRTRGYDIVLQRTEIFQCIDLPVNEWNSELYSLPSFIIIFPFQLFVCRQIFIVFNNGHYGLVTTVDCFFFIFVESIYLYWYLIMCLVQIFYIFKVKKVLIVCIYKIERVNLVFSCKVQYLFSYGCKLTLQVYVDFHILKEMLESLNCIEWIPCITKYDILYIRIVVKK